MHTHMHTHMHTRTHIHTHTPTHTQDGRTALYLAASAGHVDVVMLLLGTKADPNLPDVVITGTSLHSCVCIFACLDRPLTMNHFWLLICAFCVMC